MPGTNEPRRLEEAAFNAWPALQTVLVDGWVLRFAGGYTKRANSINPTYPAHDTNLASAMDRCEALFALRRLPAIVRMTSFGAPDGMDEMLAARGFRHADLSIVMERALDSTLEMATDGLVINAVDPDTWLDFYEAFSGAPVAQRVTHREMLRQITGDCFFAVLTDPREGRTVACGLAVRENDLAGLFEIATDPAMRRRGYGRAIVNGMMEWATNRGARTAYLQVVAHNEPARRLYEQLGFNDAYSYWYRIPVTQ